MRGLFGTYNTRRLQPLLTIANRTIIEPIIQATNSPLSTPFRSRSPRDGRSRAFGRAASNGVNPAPIHNSKYTIILISIIVY